MAEAPSFPGSESPLRILLIGRCGSGKSASGNTILGQKLFTSPKRYREKVTTTCEEHTCSVSGREVCVIDTPDLLDPNLTEDKLRQEKEKLISLCQDGLHAVLLVFPIGEQLQNEEEMLGFIRRLFGSRITDFVFLLFTRGDELEDDETIEQQIQKEDLHQLIDSCSGRFHVFDNKNLSKNQVKELLEKIDTLITSNGERFFIGQRRANSKDQIIHFSGETLTEGAAGDFHQVPESKEQRRLVLLGKTGVGKSAAGNTILGKKLFKSEASSSSQTRECSSEKLERGGKEIVVIDTPGLFDTNLSQEETTKEILKCMTYSCPGPHAFLIVIRVGRFTPEERGTVKQLKDVFTNSERYSMILFTCKDELAKDKKTAEQYLQMCDPELKALLESCGNRFLFFDNNAPSFPQFKDLMGKIDSMVAENEGQYFSNDSFQGLEQDLAMIQEEKLKEKLKSYTEEEKNQTEWQKIYWQLLEESRLEAQESLMSRLCDGYISIFCTIVKKVWVSQEEKESAIKAAESKGVTRSQAIRAALKATNKLARQQICGVQ